jgi:hypothetical protein
LRRTDVRRRTAADRLLRIAHVDADAPHVLVHNLDGERMSMNENGPSLFFTGGGPQRRCNICATYIRNCDAS